MSKTTSQTIHFVISKQGIKTEVRTKEYDYKTPQDKADAGTVLDEFKRKFVKADGYSITKTITVSEQRVYEVNN